MDTTIEKASAYIALHGLNVLAALAIFFAGRWLADFVSDVMEKICQRQKVDPTLTVFSKNLIYYALLTFVFVAVLSRLGIQTASFVAVLGAAGFAVGMALQGSLANFAAGVMIILFRPFCVGDNITAGGVTGKVREIQIFETVLSSLENVKIVVPNSHMIGNTVLNFSAHPERVVAVTVGISYEDDIKKARKIVLDLLSSDRRVLKNPEPAVVVSALADSSVNLTVKSWVKIADYDAVLGVILENIKEAFDQNGITIPYPQRTVRMVTAAAGS